MACVNLVITLYTLSCLCAILFKSKTVLRVNVCLFVILFFFIVCSKTEACVIIFVTNTMVYFILFVTNTTVYFILFVAIVVGFIILF